MWHAAWDFCTESIEKENIDDEFEFFENYSEKRLEEIQEKKPWYNKQMYDHD